MAIFRIGQSVKVRPHLDIWMQGLRRGTVTAITRNGVRVQLYGPLGAPWRKPVLFRNPADSLEAD
jgi:hypothetical protein